LHAPAFSRLLSSLKGSCMIHMCLQLWPPAVCCMQDYVRCVASRSSTPRTTSRAPSEAYSALKGCRVPVYNRLRATPTWPGSSMQHDRSASTVSSTSQCDKSWHL
jgi:hypothetical protein